MKTSIVKKLVSKIKNIMAKLKDKKLNAINNQNNFNEEHEDIINENIYNERLEASLGYLVATSASCPPQMLTFLLEDGLSISFHSGCQAAQPQASWTPRRHFQPELLPVQSPACQLKMMRKDRSAQELQETQHLTTISSNCLCFVLDAMYYGINFKFYQLCLSFLLFIANNTWIIFLKAQMFSFRNIT